MDEPWRQTGMEVITAQGLWGVLRKWSCHDSWLGCGLHGCVYFVTVLWGVHLGYVCILYFNKKFFQKSSRWMQNFKTTITVDQLTRSQERWRDKAEFRLLEIWSFPDFQIIGINASKLWSWTSCAQPDVPSPGSMLESPGELKQYLVPGPCP